MKFRVLAVEATAGSPGGEHIARFVQFEGTGKDMIQDGFEPREDGSVLRRYSRDVIEVHVPVAQALPVEANKVYQVEVSKDTLPNALVTGSVRYIQETAERQNKKRRAKAHITVIAGEESKGVICAHLLQKNQIFKMGDTISCSVTPLQEE